MVASQKPKKTFEPTRILEFLINIIKVGIRPAAGDYLKRDWTWKWNIFLLQITGCISLTGICYIHTGYQNRHDLSELVFSLCLIMADFLGIQRISKFMMSQPVESLLV